MKQKIANSNNRTGRSLTASKLDAWKRAGQTELVRD